MRGNVIAIYSQKNPRRTGAGSKGRGSKGEGYFAAVKPLPVAAQ